MSIENLLREAVRRFNAMTPAEQEEHLRAQRESWVRGKKGIGDDRAEAEYRRGTR